MLVACPVCAKTYTLSAADLGGAGRDVVCSRCDAAWFVVSDEVPALSPHERVVEPAPAPARMPQPVLARRRTVGVPALICVGLTILILASAVLGARHRIVAFWPGLSAAYAAVGLPVDKRGLALGKVQARVAEGSGGLSVSGEITNIRHASSALPRLRFALRDEAGTEVYAWSTAASKPKLKAGEKLAFEVHLDAPPKNMAAVEVRFADNQR